MTTAGYSAFSGICRTLARLPTNDDQLQVMRAVRFLTGEYETTLKGPTMNPNEPEQNVTPPTAPTLADVCNNLRLCLSDPEKELRALVAEKKVSGEAAAQAMLAVRHLEDARMRIGKIIQHGVNNGVSIYGGKTVP